MNGNLADSYLADVLCS